MKVKKTKDKTAKRKLRGSYITTIISISLVLFLIGLAGLLVLNSKKLSDYVKENIGFSIILKENVKKVDIIKLQKDLDATSYVKSTEYITKKDAAEELQKELGEDFVEFLGYNPLLASIDVKFNAQYANNDSIAIIENELKKYNQVKEVFYQKSLVHLVNQRVGQISLVILGFSALLLLISFTLINNTIRLSVYSKRFIINTMQLVGATRNFIRWPFLLRAVLNGIIGGIIAILMLSALIYTIEKEFQGIISLNDIKMTGLLFIIIILIGVIITWISTFFAVNKYLRIKNRNLYY